MNVELDKAVIGEIADFLDMGMECFSHLPSGTFEYHPEMDLGEVEEEDWQVVVDKVEADDSNY